MGKSNLEMTEIGWRWQKKLDLGEPYLEMTEIGWRWQKKLDFGKPYMYLEMTEIG